ncbi:hypothetical protein [Pectobacterium carotovorum]|uniref:hypothetical protein n=1 Tax=Pectobacterium carotovorum TaxID=554 RepID=UPI001F1BA3DB|nr:hypothetical protein [Pectobacterium carotovorum]
MTNTALYAAFEQAVPGFSAQDIITPELDKSHGEYKQIYWLDDLLGKIFFVISNGKNLIFGLWRR